MRDFLYVSGRKVERLASTLPPKVAKRLRQLSVNAGPVGASLSLADWPADTVLTAVGEIETALHDEHEIRYFTDTDLRAGHWFMADAQDMAYGVQEGRDGSGDAAVFLTEQDGVRLFLSGSAEYLRDRSIPTADAGQSMSEPQSITKLLRSLEAEAISSKWDDDYAVANLLRVFERYGMHPLTFLARALRVNKGTRGADRLVIGTPLYVAHAVPD